MISHISELKDTTLTTYVVNMETDQLNNNPLMQKNDSYYKNVIISNGQTISSECVCTLNSTHENITLYFPSNIDPAYQYDSIVIVAISSEDDIPTGYNVVLPTELLDYTLKPINITPSLAPSLSGNYIYTYTFRKDDVNKEYVVIEGGKRAVGS